MTTKSKNLIFSLIAVFCSFFWSLAQDDLENNEADSTVKLNFYDYRGTNVLGLGVGPSVLIGDYDEKEFGLYYRFGYKRSITPHIFLGLSANRYTLSSAGVDQDLMSYDFNLEYLVLPFERFSPFFYGGFGINTSSDVDANSVKSQVGIGGEYIVADRIGVKLFYEYNYGFEDETEFLIADDRNDKFMRVGIGLNYYFGGAKQREKVSKNSKTIINSNLLNSDY